MLPVGMGPPGTKMMGNWPNEAAPMNRPGTILSQMPNNNAESKASLATAVALSHEAFDSALLLGICDKIVPGLFIGAASFGQLPIIFVPGGPMPTGSIANKQKAEVRQRYAEGLATRDELLAAEMNSYHNAGTCTFYGTANSNQMLMEMMGLHVPGAAFVNPNT